MFLINLNDEIAACILSFRKSRHKPNLESTFKYGFSPYLGGKNGGVLSMRMQVILDSSFARPGSAPIWGGKKGEFRNWTNWIYYKQPFNFAAGTCNMILLLVLNGNLHTCPIHLHWLGPHFWFTVRTDRKSSYEPRTPFIRSAHFFQLARLASER